MRVLHEHYPTKRPRACSSSRGGGTSPLRTRYDTKKHLPTGEGYGTAARRSALGVVVPETIDTEPRCSATSSDLRQQE